MAPSVAELAAANFPKCSKCTERSEAYEGLVAMSRFAHTRRPKKRDVVIRNAWGQLTYNIPGGRQPEVEKFICMECATEIAQSGVGRDFNMEPWEIGFDIKTNKPDYVTRPHLAVMWAETRKEWVKRINLDQPIPNGAITTA